MNPSKVRRDRLNCLTDLPNIGPSIAADLNLLGITHPTELVGRDPYTMYEDLSRVTCVQQDPCVLDVFISMTRFMSGSDWWEFTSERKRALNRTSP